MPPLEADPPLIIDPDAVLSSPVARQLLEPIARRDAEVPQIFGGIENQELAKGSALELQGPPPHPLPLKDLLGVRVPEALDHLAS